jgi:hypothetical protein
MSPVVTIVVPLLICLVAALIARHEIKLYRRRHTEESDLFVYTKARLARRMVGVGLMLALALDLAAMGFKPPRSAEDAEGYIGIALGLVFALVLLPLWDMVATARSAKPGAGLKHGGKLRVVEGGKSDDTRPQA